MGIKERQELPRGLEDVRRQLARWRQTRKVRESVPDKLWDAAVRMARLYGVSPTAQALRLNYARLKKRVEQHRVAAVKAKEAKNSPRFVELAPMPFAGGGECLVELENTGGAKMRIQLKGAAMSDLAMLARAFLHGEGRP